MPTIDFTEQEIQANMGLIDLAVKAAGMQAAEAALVVSRKLVAALNAGKGQAGADKADPAAAPAVGPALNRKERRRAAAMKAK